ncbi:hypothetical protein B0H19DRAFT_1063557 [Mycena capillaripes]|nr:hypothetical protein B0H19DRAFT_1063557 [Mycena capillaripes]
MATSNTLSLVVLIMSPFLGTFGSTLKLPATTDWAQITYIGYPLATPWWAEVNIAVGFVFFFWILTPALYRAAGVGATMPRRRTRTPLTAYGFLPPRAPALHDRCERAYCSQYIELLRFFSWWKLIGADCMLLGKKTEALESGTLILNPRSREDLPIWQVSSVQVSGILILDPRIREGLPIWQDGAPSMSFDLFTSSPLVVSLPLSIPELRNEKWREWEYDLPKYIGTPVIDLKLVKEIAECTNTKLNARIVTPLIKSARAFGTGTATAADVGGSPKNLNAILHWIYGLQILDFIGSENGLPHDTSETTCVQYELPTTSGKLDRSVTQEYQILTHMAKWPTIVASIKKQLTQLETTNFATSLGSADPEVCMMRHKVSDLVREFKLTAFCIAWHRRGKFEIPEKLEELFDYFAECGIQVDKTCKEISSKFESNNYSTADILKPGLLALSISFLVLFLPIDLIAHSYNSLELAYVPEKELLDAMKSISEIDPKESAYLDLFVKKSTPSLALNKTGQRSSGLPASLAAGHKSLQTRNSQSRPNVSSSRIDPSRSSVTLALDKPGQSSNQLAASLAAAYTTLQTGNSGSSSDSSSDSSELSSVEELEADLEAANQHSGSDFIDKNDQTSSMDRSNDKSAGIDSNISSLVEPVNQDSGSECNNTNDQTLSSNGLNGPSAHYEGPLTLDAQSQFNSLPVRIDPGRISSFSTEWDFEPSHEVDEVENFFQNAAESLPGDFLPDLDNYVFNSPPTFTSGSTYNLDSPQTANNVNNTGWEQCSRAAAVVATDQLSTSIEIAVLTPDSPPANEQPTPHPSPDIRQSTRNVYRPEYSASDFSSGSQRSQRPRRQRQRQQYLELMGRDDIMVKNLGKDAQTRPVRCSVGKIVYIFNVDRHEPSFGFMYYGWLLRSKHPQTGEDETTAANDYRVLDSNQLSWMASFVDLSSLSLPQSLALGPLYYLDNLPGWLKLSRAERQEVFKKRHIVIKKAIPQIELDEFARDPFYKMGIPLDRPLEMADLAFRKLDDPSSAMRTGDARTFLEEASKPNGMVLSLLDLPLDGVTEVPRLEGFDALDTSGAAYLYTRQRTGLQWIGAESHAFATLGMIMMGKKLWSAADEGSNVPGSSTSGHMDTIHAFDNWDSLTSPNTNCRRESILLEAGDVIFAARSTMIPHIWSFFHIAIQDNGVTAETHEDTSTMYPQIFAYWFLNLEAAHEGRPPSLYAEVHLPNILTWEGVMNIILLGNTLVFLDPLNYKNYLDLKRNGADQLTTEEIEDEKTRRLAFKSQNYLARQNFTKWRSFFLQHYRVETPEGVPVNILEDIFYRSIVHTAVVLTFYKRDDTSPPLKAKLWTPPAFELQLIAALNDYDDDPTVNSRLATMYQEGVSQTEPPSHGRFMPSDWTDSTYNIVARGDPKGKRKAVYDANNQNQPKRRARVTWKASQANFEKWMVAADIETSHLEHGLVTLRGKRKVHKSMEGQLAVLHYYNLLEDVPKQGSALVFFEAGWRTIIAKWIADQQFSLMPVPQSQDSKWKKKTLLQLFGGTEIEAEAKLIMSLAEAEALAEAEEDAQLNVRAVEFGSEDEYGQTKLSLQITHASTIDQSSLSETIIQREESVASNIEIYLDASCYVQPHGLKEPLNIFPTISGNSHCTLMAFLRTKPHGTTKACHNCSFTRGKAYLYTKLKGTSIKIQTETSRLDNIVASNVGLAHISKRITKLPYLAVEENFTADFAVIEDFVVAVGSYQFLISAHYSPKAPINGALTAIAPGFNWRGEVVIVALGKNKPYISRMNALSVGAALNKFMAAYLSHIHQGLALPVAMM